jgi:glycosyltransferase 2 family protein
MEHVLPPSQGSSAFQRMNLGHWLGVAAGFAVLALATFALMRLSREVHYADIVAAVHATPTRALLLSVVFTVASYVVLTGYDLLAVRHLGYVLRYRLIALASFTSYTMSHTLGVTVLTGGTVRYRMYTRVGVTPIDVALIILLCGFTFWLGIVMLAGIGLVVSPELAGPFGTFAPGAERWAGALLLGGAASYWALATWWRHPLKAFGHVLYLPSGRETFYQLLLGAADLGCAAAALYVLLPDTGLPPFATFLTVYAVAMIVGAMSHSPGGLGVFEAVTMLMLPGAPKAEMLGALFLFRIIYTVVPFLIGLVLLTLSEFAALRDRRRVVKLGAAASQEH